MSFQRVTTQEELDKALAEGVKDIEINSPKGMWINISATGSSTVWAYGSSTVWAYDSSTVRAYGSSTVRAYDSSTVWAYGSSTVQAYGSSTVQAYDSSTVQAYGSSTVQAYGSSTVRAYGSSTVWAYGLSTVRAYGSSTVRAYDSSTVRAYDSSTVQATARVAVQLYSAHVTTSGGVIIDVTDTTSTTNQWMEYHGLTSDDSGVTVYKAVNSDLIAGERWTPTTYTIGDTITAPDWASTNECGHGLHFSPTPGHAADCYIGETEISELRYLACRINPDEAILLADDKIKAPSCVVLHEVTIDGRPTAK